jgi:long-chain acyl-CoA synthetase
VEPYRLRHQVREHAASQGQHPALVRVGSSLTYAELDVRADRFAAGLVAAGLQPGDRVALLLANATETFEALLGCARAGLVAVPLNWRLAPEELAEVARDARPRATVVEVRTAHLAPSLAAPGTSRLDLTLGEDYEQWLAVAEGGLPELADDPDRVVLQVYTSGTSGRPKGVLLTDANLATKVPGVVPWWGLEPGSRTLLATPLFHVGALSWGLAGLFAGSTTVLAADADPARLLQHLQQDRISHTFLVPAIIDRLCAEAGPGLAFPHLTRVMYGASPITAETQRAARDLFGPVLHQLYGMSETTGAFTEMSADPALDPASPRWRSAGLPYPWVEVEVHDPSTGRRCATGEFGEVWTRSGQNSPGYSGLAVESAELYAEGGWLRTGDGGHLDEDGLLYLTDRVKDLIISGGENIYPAEVERVLRQHPDVAEAVAIGVPDETWGEVVTVVVVARSGTELVPEELTSWAGERLAGYKRPRHVVVVDGLPRNAAGKVLRRMLRDDLATTAVRDSLEVTS